MYVMIITLEILILILLLVILKESFPIIEDYIKIFSDSIGQDKNRVLYRKNIKKEKLDLNFNEIYSQLYENNNSILENKRCKYRNNHFCEFMLGIPLFLSFIGLSLYSIDKRITIASFLLIIVFGILFIINSIKHDSSKKDYIEYYKENIIKRLISKVFNNFKYTYNFNDHNIHTFASNIFYNAYFEEHNYGNISCDDLIETNLDDGTDIKIMEIKNICGSFRGIVTYIRNNKEVSDEIKITRNRTKLSKKDNIVMDSNEFEKYFDVHSNNKIIAMQVLTSDLIQLIDDFYNKFNLQFEIVIKNGIYISFVTGHLFEPRVYKKCMKQEELFIYYSVLEFIRDLSKTLNDALNSLEI